MANWLPSTTIANKKEEPHILLCTALPLDAGISVTGGEGTVDSTMITVSTEFVQAAAATQTVVVTERFGSGVLNSLTTVVAFVKVHTRARGGGLIACGWTDRPSLVYQSILRCPVCFGFARWIGE